MSEDLKNSLHYLSEMFFTSGMKHQGAVIYFPDTLVNADVHMATFKFA